MNNNNNNNNNTTTTTPDEQPVLSVALCDALIAHENGTLGASNTLALYAKLISTGLAWKLQGGYGRAAASLIRAGYIDGDGIVTARGIEAIEQAEAEGYGGDDA